MKLSKMAWVCLILVPVVWAPFRISGAEQPQQEDPKLSGPLISQPPILIQQLGSKGQVQIRGPKGLCLEYVPQGKYYDGAELTLVSCRSSATSNQLWTFKEDGTIRSNGSCLMPASVCPTSPVNNLMLSTCPDDPIGSSAQWKHNEDEGFMLNSLTGLVLTAKSDAEGVFGALTVDVDKGLPGQGWVRDDGPSLQRIESRQKTGSCLTVGDDYSSVGLGRCLNSTRNNWEIVPFSTIANNGKCLSCQDSVGRARPCKDGSLVVTRDCCVESPGQRWLDGGKSRFVNPESGLYLTLADSGDHVIAAPKADPADLPFQQWNLL
ncbi:hypothetical protein Tsubulata_032924 [Turnera subulata]|uniref:Ricin B lectin domain-containing protein n=1 Tax=Turnera subulata TaxID=218843 RepID=A0A9Q0FEJ0_9ROSI|nr:hypothetical protein Tsubulata_032924 [Turnera subulata]